MLAATETLSLGNLSSPNPLPVQPEFKCNGRYDSISVTMAILRWLLLTHQLPNEPSNLRVKVWRKLQALGAVPVKNSIYVLPNKASSREDFEWLRKEIVQSGGEASVFAAESIAESDDAEIIRSFREARAKDYAVFLKTVRAFVDKAKGAVDGGHIKAEAIEKLEREWEGRRLEWERISKIDFFEAPERKATGAAMSDAQGMLHKARALTVKQAPAPPPPLSPKDVKAVVWVTRTGPHIDRLASAWLIRRFIDPKARIKFVKAPYAPKPKEARFDMPEGEFTHFGDWCTFETLIRRFRLDDPALTALSEVIHDIDLKDRKFARPEASGVALAIRGLCRRFPADEERLTAGLDFFEGLYLTFAAEAKR